jgi:hypothetical protein
MAEAELGEKGCYCPLITGKASSAVWKRKIENMLDRVVSNLVIYKIISIVPG